MSLHAERLGRGGARLVLVHGFTQTGRSWDPLADDLARDHEVVLVDAPGHGASSDVRADLVAGARLLGDDAGPGVYVGYSMGARLCLHLALARPELVAGLVLLGGTAGIDDDAERADRRTADEALARQLERDGLDAFLERWLAKPMFAGLAPEATQLDDRRRNTVAGLASSLRLAGAGSQAPRWDRLGQLDQPVLLLAGEQDRKFADLGRRMAAAIGDNARFETIRGAGHAAHLERPATFLDILRRWLAERGW